MRIVYFITAVVISGLLVRVFLLDSFIVEGNSMAPTIHDGDYVLVSKAAYRFAPPERHDIIVGQFRGMEKTHAIKRIVGLPGEWVFIENGTIWTATERDGGRTKVGKVDTESYAGDVAETIAYRLDPYEYFVIGDNGLTSIDSRALGPIDLYRIQGRVFGSFRGDGLSLITF